MAKRIIAGIKNSQKIRVILNGVGIYMTVKDTDTMFATIQHRSAVLATLAAMAKEKSTGFVQRVEHYDTTMTASYTDCQVDLL